jgi:hypothetical protein
MVAAGLGVAEDDHARLGANRAGPASASGLALRCSSAAAATALALRAAGLLSQKVLAQIGLQRSGLLGTRVQDLARRGAAERRG